MLQIFFESCTLVPCLQLWTQSIVKQSPLSGAMESESLVVNLVQMGAPKAAWHNVSN